MEKVTILKLTHYFIMTLMWYKKNIFTNKY